MSLIKKPHEIIAPELVKVLIYGQPGIGKSTLAMSTKRALVFDFDAGAHRVKLKHRKDVVQVSSWNDVLDVLDKEDLSMYDSIVYDTASKMLDFVGAFIIAGNAKMGRGGNLTLQGYGERKTIFRNHFHRLARMGKKMIVFVAHDKEEKRGEETVIRPEIGGSSGTDLLKELDLVGYMEANGKKRTISFDPCEKFYGKNTCDLAPLIELPDLEKPGAENEFLENIIKEHEAAGEARRETEYKYTDVMAVISRLVDEVETADDANDFIDRMKEAEHVWDSKLQASVMLRERCKKLGLAFSKGSGKYEAKEGGDLLV